jgi:hypothetical protein
MLRTVNLHDAASIGLLIRMIKQANNCRVVRPKGQFNYIKDKWTVVGRDKKTERPVH